MRVKKNQIKSKWTRDSLRTVVGSPQAETLPTKGMAVLDTNDSGRFFGLFAVCDGDPGFAEFCPEFLRNRFESSSDIFNGGGIDQPQKYLTRLLKEALEEWRRAARERGGGEPDVSAFLVIRGSVIAARCGTVPIFLWQSRRMRPVFHLDRRPQQEVEAVVFNVAEGDRIVMCPNETMERLTKFELKNALASEEDPTLVAGKLTMLASRYEEIKEPRILVVGFGRNSKQSNGVVPRKTLITAGVALALILVLFLWGDIYRFIEGHKSPYVFRGDREGAEAEGGLRDYKPVEVYGGLAVPYDAAVNGDELFIVDDREAGVVYFNMADKSAGRINVNPGLIFPTGIEIFRDILYVVDFSSSASNVYLLTRSGDFLRRISDGGSARLRNPKAVAIGGDGSIYVCDRANNRILKFSGEAKLLRTIKLPENMLDPNGIALTSGGDIYITLKTSNGIARITDEKSVKAFTVLQGEDIVSLSRPAGIAVDKKNYIYVADTGNRRIVVADPIGHLTGIIDSASLADLVSFYPMSVKIDSAGEYLYIVGSNQFSYESKNSGITKGKIWRVKI